MKSMAVNSEAECSVDKASHINTRMVSFASLANVPSTFIEPKTDKDKRLYGTGYVSMCNSVVSCILENPTGSHKVEVTFALF